MPSFHFDTYFWLMLGVFILNLLLAFFVLLRNRRNLVNQAFFLFIFSMCLWIFALIVYYYSTYNVLAFGRLTYVFGSVLLPVTGLYFVHVFPRRLFDVKNQWIFFILFEALARAIIGFFTPAIYAEEIIVNNSRETIFGDFYLLMQIPTIVYLILIIGLLIYKYYRMGGIFKFQIRYILFGFFLSASFIVATVIVIPPLTGNFDLQKTGPVYTVFFFLVTSYAIIKYRLMDIRTVVSRSLIFATMAAFITASFVAVTYLMSLYISQDSAIAQIEVFFVAALILVVIIDPLKNLLGKATNRIFFKAAIDYPEATKRITNVVSEEIELSSLIRRLSKEVENQLQISSVQVLLPVGGDAFIFPDELRLNEKGVEVKRKKSLQNDSVLIQHIMENVGSILILDELDRKVADARVEEERQYWDAIRVDMEQMAAFAVLPIVSAAKKNLLSAILVLSGKQSGEGFSVQDIQLLEVIAPQVSSAIQKARLYQEEREFAEKLKREIFKATKELKLANKNLKELDTAKSEFMSIASHQLRTPLAGIMGYLSMILGGDYGKVTAEQKQVLDDIMQAGQRLTRLVNAFLNATRIEAGRLVINYAEAPFHDVIEGMYKELLPTAEKKHVKLVYKKTELPVVQMDIDKLKDVALNLIDNAIKYSPGASVTVWGEQVDKNTVRFICKDTGVGIPKGQASSLFSKFVRGSGIAQVEPNGSGLGLFIAKKIIEAHGGRIWAESEGEGKGSTFQFEIPIHAANVPQEKGVGAKIIEGQTTTPSTTPDTNSTAVTKTEFGHEEYGDTEDSDTKSDKEEVENSPVAHNNKTSKLAHAPADTATKLKKKTAKEILKQEKRKSSVTKKKAVAKKTSKKVVSKK